MPRVALFAGSLDPITNGHLDVVRSAVRLADRLVLPSGSIPARRRCSRSRSAWRCFEVCTPLGRGAGCEIACTTFGDLVVSAAQRAGATILIRGLRDAADFDYEMQMAGMNAAISPGLQTVFLPASPEVRPITATLVRQIASMGGDVSAFVPAQVAALLRRNLRRPETGPIREVP